jgi:putative solute:sodium symporter small subunit
LAREYPDTQDGGRRAARLPVVALLLLILLAVGVPLLVRPLNLIDVLAFPLGYFMLAQGSLIGFVLVGIASARWQDRRERRRATVDT